MVKQKMGVYGLFPSGPGGYHQNTFANAGDVRDPGSILGWEDSCLENPMDRGARQAAVYRVAKRSHSPQGRRESDMTEASRRDQCI